MGTSVVKRVRLAVHTLYSNLKLCSFLVYLNVKNLDYGEKTWIDIDIAKNASSVSRYRIRVTQLACEDTALLAPPGCLTYSTDLAGTISSFNYADGTGEMINNQNFYHCIKYQEGYCDVSLIASEFDVGEVHDTGDSLLIGSTFLTGNNFANDGTLLCRKII